MRFGKPPGVPCPPNNPHCHGIEPVDAPLDNPVFIAILIILAVIFVFIKLKNRHDV